MKSSLLSVTFRGMTIAQIAELAARGGVAAIEWGSDVHVPAGDQKAAAEAVSACREHGLAVSAYGAYYNCDEEDFAPYIETALALGTDIIRVWANNGIESSGTLPASERARVVATLQKCVEMAAKAGITVATEFHPNTLTDTLESTQQLLSEVPGLYTYWQPVSRLSAEENLSQMRALGKKVKNLHAFYLVDGKRRPLEDGAENWLQYLTQAQQVTDAGYVGIEFVRGGTAEQFLADAKTLNDILQKI